MSIFQIIFKAHQIPYLIFCVTGILCGIVANSYNVHLCYNKRMIDGFANIMIKYMLKYLKLHGDLSKIYGCNKTSKKKRNEVRRS